MKQSTYEILEYYLEQKLNGNIMAEKESRKLFKRLGKTEDEIDHLLIEFDDEWTKEQLQGNGRKKGRKMLIFGSIGFLVTSAFTIILSFQGILSYIPYGFVAFMAFIMLKGSSEIRDAKYRKERRAFKWENWK